MKASKTASETIAYLVDKLRHGEIRLPEMQRSYVWTAAQVRDLLDSLYREYPSGTILTWDPGNEGDVELRESAVSQDTSGGSYKLLLDGQQRLTSLAAVLCGEPVTVRNRVRPIDILFNLEHPEDVEVITEVEEGNESTEDNEDESEQGINEGLSDANDDELLERFKKMTFIVYSSRLAMLPQWVSVSKLFKDGDPTDTLLEMGMTNLADPLCKKYQKRLNRLLAVKDYPYPVYNIEKGKSYEEVTEIFVRVNSRGTKLRSSDLALAQITAKWKGSLEIFQQAENFCKEENYDLGLSVLLKNLMAFTTGQCKFNPTARLTPEQLKEGWSNSDKWMKHSIGFLRGNGGIENSKLLSSPFVAIVTAYHAYKHMPQIESEESKMLRYWVLMASLKGRYSRGSSDTLLDQDLKATRESGASGLIKILKGYAGRLDVQESDVSNLLPRSAYFKTMFLAFKKNEAPDWDSNVVIAFNNSGGQKLQFHHIFPRKNLNKIYDKRQQIDDIRNLAFIGAATNRRLGAKLPEEYMADVDPVALKKQCVPLDEHLWKLENYEDFLIERGKLITERLNEFLGPDPTEEN